jgi:hypothetical protein
VYSSRVSRVTFRATSAGVGETGGDEVLSCTGEDSPSEGEVRLCWLGLVVLAMLAEVALIQGKGAGVLLARDDGCARCICVGRG